MSFGHALYYPHINLTNKNWIKHSLLFWDRISRIVPHAIEPSDSEEIIKIKNESDFIHDYHPEKWDTSSTFKDFSHELRQMLESDGFFTERFLRSSRHRGRYSHYYDNRRQFFLETIGSEGTYIHVEKLDSRMKEYLFQVGVAIPGESEWEDWIKIDGEVGLLYMTYFAKAISKNKSTSIVTDTEKSFSTSMMFESAVNSDYNSKFEYQLGNLLIETVVPKNINNVSLDTLLSIRKNYKSERAAFFNEIASLSNSISEIDNANALADALSIHSNVILKEVNELERLYNLNKIETCSKFLNISLPTTVAALNQHIPEIAKPIVAVGGLIFGIVSATSAVKKERLELKSNPKSYLLNVKSELSGEGIFQKINDSIKGLRKW